MIIVSAMLIAGTRNNILVAIILPATLFVFYSRNKFRDITLLLAIFLSALFFYQSEILTLFDQNEPSNSAKLNLLMDYFEILNNPKTIIFGNGLGSYEDWSIRTSYVTELTYLEIFRNFGFIFGPIIIYLLLYPVIYAFIINKSYNEKHIQIGYVAYLFMSISNPLLFSSMGMLFLSIILSSIYLYKNNLTYNL
jgi:hypothetical protein